MASTYRRKIFVNLSVKNLKHAMQFFRRLGFQFDMQFTDENAACMVISEEAYVMLLAEPFFKTFTSRQICDTRTHTEGLFALSCESRAEVDGLVKKALDGGGKSAHTVQDKGFMYARSFYDLDGHHWDVLWMDPAATQPSA